MQWHLPCTQYKITGFRVWHERAKTGPETLLQGLQWQDIVGDDIFLIRKKGYKTHDINLYK